MRVGARAFSFAKSAAGEETSNPMVCAELRDHERRTVGVGFRWQVSPLWDFSSTTEEPSRPLIRCLTAARRPMVS